MKSLKILVPIFALTFSHLALAFNKNYLVRVKPEIKSSTVISELLPFQSKIIRDYKKLGLLLIEIPDLNKLNRIQKELLPKLFLYLEEDFKLKAFVSPNDDQYGNQTELARLDIEKSWDKTTGSNDIIVAVIDTGISANHSDLKNQVYVNSKEIPDNGIDDDKNGFVDDVSGWNFVNNDHKPIDLNGHGTHVSGTIGAEGNNSIGVTGINWDIKIMPVQFLDGEGSGNSSDAISAIFYAADNGAKIINASWGGGSFSKSLLDAINYAGKKEVLFVAAAGNDSSNSDAKPSYPASYDSSAIISVASTDDVGKLSSFSNFGLTQVDLAAPGGKILSTYLNDSYKRLSGTSMATPMVVGLAALMLSYRPDLTLIQLKNGLLNSVKYHENFKGKFSTEGEINGLKALNQLDDTSLQIWPQKLNLKAGTDYIFNTFGGTAPFSWTISNSELATISQSGILKIKSEGEGSLTINVQDASGKVVSTDTINIVKVSSSGGGGGGCVKEAYAGTNSSSRNSQIWDLTSYLLIILAYLLRKKIFRKKIG
ncbi:MAG: S8 family serine peptidase [Bacteriovoracaceae bacterium]